MKREPTRERSSTVGNELKNLRQLFKNYEKASQKKKSAEDKKTLTTCPKVSEEYVAVNFAKSPVNPITSFP